MSITKGISVILLSYQEEENLKILLPQIIDNLEKLKEEYEILVIDTQKPLDNTQSVCNQYHCKYINQEWPHFAGAFKTGIKYAQKEKFLIMDSDGSHNPDTIPELNKMFKENSCDVVIGSRYVEGGKTNDKIVSICMSRILNTVFRICLGIKAKDISTDYRMYDTAQLKRVVLTNNNYDVLQEVLLKMKLENPELKIGEVPITFNKRLFGESKRQLVPFIIDYIKSLFRLTAMRFPALHNLVLYGIFGILGAFIEYSIFYILNQYFLINKPECSNILAAICGFIFTFIMNTFLNFKKNSRLIFRLFSYGSICLSGMIVSTLIIHIFKDFVNIYLLKASLMIFVSLIQFFLNKLITYSR